MFCYFCDKVQSEFKIGSLLISLVCVDTTPVHLLSLKWLQETKKSSKKTPKHSTEIGRYLK